jgi:hypothetical protein
VHGPTQPSKLGPESLIYRTSLGAVHSVWVRRDEPSVQTGGSFLMLARFGLKI